MESGKNQSFFTRVLLAIGVGFLGFLALRPAVTPLSVNAQSPAPNVYIEPGTISIRTPDGGGAVGDGKMVVDLKTGDVWGFPTNVTGSPYPVDPINKQAPIVKPVYLGRFDFAEMKVPMKQ